MDLNTCIKRAQKGDKNAFGKLKRLYWPETAFLAARFLLDEAEAREAADAVFADAQDKLARLRDPELFERWLCWCTARECRERLRDRAPVLFTDRKGGYVFDQTMGIPQKGERIPPKKRELTEKIVAAVDELPVLQRFPFLYSRFCGYSIEETAAFLGLNEDTVAFRVHAGEAALYEAVHNEPGAKHAGLGDMILALRDYPVRYIRPSEEEADRDPYPEDELPEEEDSVPVPDEEEEDGEEKPHRTVTLPILIAVCGLLLAALIFFLIFTLKDNKRKKSAPTTATFQITAPTAEPGKAAVTALPKSALTPPPTSTPAPTATYAPTPTPPDTAGLESAPEENEWLIRPYSAFVCGQGINVRKGPTTRYKILGTLSAGQQVTVYAARDNWYLVEYTQDKLGWTSGSYLFSLNMFEDGTNDSLAGITPPVNDITTVEPKTVGAFSGARLCRDPSESATYIETAEYGTKAYLLCFDGDWIFVNEGGKFGWMQRDAFDTSNAMDVSSGTYHYTVAPKAVIEDTGSVVRVEATLWKGEYITPANAEKYLSGETVKTKKGTKLKPEFRSMEKSPREIEPGIPAEISFDQDELRFVYDADQKLYAVYTHAQQKLYSYKKLVLIIRPNANVTDMRFCPVYEVGAPSFGQENADGCFLFNANKLDDFVEYVRSYGVYDGLSGSLTVRNGAVMELTIEYEE